MKKIYILIAFILLPLIGFGQSSFHFLHDYDSTADGTRNIVLRSDNSLLIHGAAWKAGIQRAIWMNFSAGGSVVLSKHEMNTPPDGYYSDYSGNIKALSGGGYVVPFTFGYPPLVQITYMG